MKIDFRTKLLVMLTITTICISGISQNDHPYLLLFYQFIALSFLIHGKTVFLAIKGTLVLGAAFLLNRFGLPFFPSGLGVFLSLVALLLLKMVPGALISYYAITSTSMSDLVASLKRMKVPDALTIPISVMFRFFYSVKEDYFYINDAMKMHGLTLRTLFTQPLRLIEYKFVPLLMCSVNVADDVTISAMTRGMVVDNDRSTISTTKLRWQDYLCFLFVVVLWGVYIRSIYA